MGKMFRRKPEIPLEPVIPTPEQILEDVLNSPDNDSVFHVPSKEVGRRKGSAEKRIQSSKANVTFEKVRGFVELHENLKDCLQQLKDKCESLKISDCELKAMADDIRKQSIEALQ